MPPLVVALAAEIPADVVEEARPLNSLPEAAPPFAASTAVAICSCVQHPDTWLRGAPVACKIVPSCAHYRKRTVRRGAADWNITLSCGQS